MPAGCCRKPGAYDNQKPRPIGLGRGGIGFRLCRSRRGEDISSGQVLVQGLVGDGKHQQGDDDVGQHIGQIVQQGVEPRAVHGHAEEGLGHILGPDGGAHHIVDQEPGEASDQRAGEHAALAAGHQAGQAQHGEGHQIVAQDGLPADGEAAVKHELQHAEGEAAQQTGAQAPTDGIQHQRHHGQHHAAAPGHLPDL